MDRPRLIRGLRIAWSVVCGIMCVLLVALWVRSFHNRDLVFFVGTYADSSKGRILLFTLPNGNGPWNLQDHPSYAPGAKTMLGFPFGYGVVPAGPYVIIQYWFLVLVSGVTTTIPWKPWKWRFSLRTLLIATTLIAVVLGFGVAYLRLL